MAITKQQAMQVAAEIAAKSPGGVDLTLLENETVERDFGWAFFYESTRGLETGSMYDQALGLGPLVVDRESGAAKFLPTSVPPDEAIDDFDARWRAQRSP